MAIPLGGRLGVLFVATIAAFAAGAAGYTGLRDAGEGPTPNDAKTAGGIAPDVGIPDAPSNEPGDAALGEESVPDIPVGYLESLQHEMALGCAAVVLIVETGDMCSGQETRQQRVLHVEAGLTRVAVRLFQHYEGANAATFCFAYTLGDIAESQCGLQDFQLSHDIAPGDVAAGDVFTIDVWLPPWLNLAYQEQIDVDLEFAYWGGPDRTPYSETHQFHGKLGCATAAAYVQTRDLCGTARVDTEAKTRFWVPFDENLTTLRYTFTAGQGASGLEFLVYWSVPANAIESMVCTGTCSIEHTFTGADAWTNESIHGRFDVRLVGGDMPAGLAATFRLDMTAGYSGAAVPA